MITLKIKKERSGPVINRHPWIFSQALKEVPGDLVSGTPVRVVNESGTFLAAGYFSSHSQIAVRLWGYDEQEEINKDFFLRRILRACDIRNNYIAGPDTDSCRLINAESDLLPGLIVDKYGDCLVLQCHTAGIEHWKDAIVSALVEAVRPAGIYERSESPSRKVERLQDSTGLLYGEVPELITIRENGLAFLVDVRRGQKTGFFLDQRDKRKALVKYAGRRDVLNCFSYTGAFTVYALSGGARRAVSVDSSADALELARENIRLNGLDTGKCEFICDDAKKYLKTVPHGEFGVIVLDPPAFIKDRRKRDEGIFGYRNINESALRILPDNGILLTCSCSSHLSLQDFRYLITEAAGKARRSVQFLETFTHGIDHGVLAPFTEGEYLKCFFAAV